MPIFNLSTETKTYRLSPTLIDLYNKLPYQLTSLEAFLPYLLDNFNTIIKAEFKNKDILFAYLTANNFIAKDSTNNYVRTDKAPTHDDMLNFAGYFTLAAKRNKFDRTSSDYKPFDIFSPKVDVNTYQLGKITPKDAQNTGNFMDFFKNDIVAPLRSSGAMYSDIFEKNINKMADMDKEMYSILASFLDTGKIETMLTELITAIDTNLGKVSAEIKSAFESNKALFDIKTLPGTINELKTSGIPLNVLLTQKLSNIIAFKNLYPEVIDDSVLTIYKNLRQYLTNFSPTDLVLKASHLLDALTTQPLMQETRLPEMQEFSAVQTSSKNIAYIVTTYIKYVKELKRNILDLINKSGETVSSEREDYIKIDNPNKEAGEKVFQLPYKLQNPDKELGVLDFDTKEKYAEFNRLNTEYTELSNPVKKENFIRKYLKDIVLPTSQEIKTKVADFIKHLTYAISEVQYLIKNNMSNLSAASFEQQYVTDIKKILSGLFKFLQESGESITDKTIQDYITQYVNATIQDNTLKQITGLHNTLTTLFNTQFKPELAKISVFGTEIGKYDTATKMSEARKQAEAEYARYMGALAEKLNALAAEKASDIISVKEEHEFPEKEKLLDIRSNLQKYLYRKASIKSFTLEELNEVLKYNYLHPDSNTEVLNSLGLTRDINETTGKNTGFKLDYPQEVKRSFSLKNIAETLITTFNLTEDKKFIQFQTFDEKVDYILAKIDSLLNLVKAKPELVETFPLSLDFNRLAEQKDIIANNVVNIFVSKDTDTNVSSFENIINDILKENVNLNSGDSINEFITLGINSYDPMQYMQIKQEKSPELSKEQLINTVNSATIAASKILFKRYLNKSLEDNTITSTKYLNAYYPKIINAVINSFPILTNTGEAINSPTALEEVLIKPLLDKLPTVKSKYFVVKNSSYYRYKPDVILQKTANSLIAGNINAAISNIFRYTPMLKDMLRDEDDRAFISDELKADLLTKTGVYDYNGEIIFGPKDRLLTLLDTNALPYRDNIEYVKSKVFTEPFAYLNYILDDLKVPGKVANATYAAKILDSLGETMPRLNEDFLAVTQKYPEKTEELKKSFIDIRNAYTALTSPDKDTISKIQNKMVETFKEAVNAPNTPLQFISVDPNSLNIDTGEFKYQLHRDKYLAQFKNLPTGITAETILELQKDYRNLKSISLALKQQVLAKAKDTSDDAQERLAVLNDEINTAEAHLKEMKSAMNSFSETFITVESIKDSVQDLKNKLNAQAGEVLDERYNFITKAKNLQTAIYNFQEILRNYKYSRSTKSEEQDKPE